MDNALSANTSVRPLIAVSPHYDDAVFSCGQLLAAVNEPAVITVYTALPANKDVLTDWDGRCGFTSAHAAMRARAAENDQALAILQAQGIDLDFLDSQYSQTTRNGDGLLIDALASTLSRLQPQTVVFPLGLFHSDHVEVSDALIALCCRFEGITWVAYEDIPYRKQPRYVQERLAGLALRGIQATPFSFGSVIKDPDASAYDKEHATNAYKSQFLGLGYGDARPIMSQTEKYWRLQANVELL